MKVLERLEDAGRVLVLAHHNADIDAVGAAIALKEYLGEKTDIGVPDTLSKGAQDLAQGYNFLETPDLENYDTVVILDCPSLEQLEPVDVKGFGGERILIDHHTPGNLSEIVEVNLTEPDTKSTSEIIYKLLKKNGRVNEKGATALICGIVADTSHLRFARPEQFQYISELLKKTKKSYSDILSILSTPTDRSERIARIKAVSRAENYNVNGYIVAFSYVGSFEAASARSLLKTGADVAVVFSPRDDELRVSGRCRRDLTDKLHLGKDVFSEIEDVLDGSAGGHDAAASGNGKNGNMDEVKDAILAKLEEVLGRKAKEL
ncbi:MAG: DHH family phosphoesterase [Candidatus Aenigmatarchaeota archaeon]